MNPAVSLEARDALKGLRTPDGFQGLRTMVHEALHSTSPLVRDSLQDYMFESTRVLEEGIVEHRARRVATSAWFDRDDYRTLPGPYLSKLTAGAYHDWVRGIDWVADHLGEGAVERIWQANTGAGRVAAASAALRGWVLSRLEAIGLTAAEAGRVSAHFGDDLWTLLLTNTVEALAPASQLRIDALEGLVDPLQAKAYFRRVYGVHF